MGKREVILLSALSFSLGIILGFVASPLKSGIININGNNSYTFKELEQESEEK